MDLIPIKQLQLFVILFLIAGAAAPQNGLPVGGLRSKGSDAKIGTSLLRLP